MKFREDFDDSQIEAIINELGGAEGARAFLRGEYEVVKVKSWTEKDGVITFTVTSDGTTGLEWIERFPNSTKWAKDLLGSPDFVPTNGVTSTVKVLKGTLFADANRVTHKIRADATRRGFTKPNAEVACLIRQKFTDEELAQMGLMWLIVMHEPIKDSVGDPSLLAASCGDDGSWLGAFYAWPGAGWDRECGFAFLAAQV